jgi:cellulose biosynthesis protein BcsQ
MKIILFFSYKGGVGRSLALCNTAAALCRNRYKVGIVDFDVEAPSIHLQMKDVLPINLHYDDYTPDILTLLRNDLEKLTPRGVEEAIISLSLPWPDSCCKFIPCFGREHDLIALENKWNDKTSTLNKIFEMFADKTDVNFLLIDARSGYTQQAILGALLADEVVAVTRADFVSIPGMKMMLDLFKYKPIEKIHLLISAIPTSVSLDDPILRSFIKELDYEGKEILIPYVPEWYFGGEVIWELNEYNQKWNEPFDLLTRQILGETQ